MISAGIGHTRTIPASFSRALRALRRCFSEAGICVVEQLDLSREFPGQFSGASKCTVLLIDCPLLFFEALALDRGAAAFIPLHIVVTGGEERTSINWAHPTAITHLRVPATARAAVDALHARVTELLQASESESLTGPVGTGVQQRVR